METSNLKLSVWTIVLATAGLLTIPLIAMQFSDEVNWRIGDFAIMGVMLITTGLGLKWALRLSGSLIHKAAIALTFGTTFLLVWANLGVGLVGSGANIANILYAVVVAVILGGTLITRLSTRGMELTNYAAIGGLVVVTLTAFIAGLQQLPNSSVTEILGVNGFFAALYLIAALLFRSASKKEHWGYGSRDQEG